MTKIFSTTEDYQAGLRRLGEMARSRAQDDSLREAFDSFLLDEKASEQIIPAFGLLCGALGLDYPEAMCVALWYYLEASDLPELTHRSLSECCARLGARSPGAVLNSIFVSTGRTVSLHPIAADFLLGREPRLPEGVAIEWPGRGELLHTKELYREILELLNASVAIETTDPILIALGGEGGSGRSFLIARLCEAMGAAILRVDLRARPAIGDILLTAKLYGAAVCLENAENPEQTRKIASGCGFVFLLRGPGDPPPECPGCIVFYRLMPEPSIADRENVLLSLLGYIPQDGDFIAEKELRRLTIGQTKQLALRLKAEAMVSGKPADGRMAARALRELWPCDVAGTQPLASSGRMGDLKLPPELSRQLAELCAFIRARDRVYADWGFGKNISWGRGISALFYGAPGTGKTMAATVLANETGLLLLRVDLSQLISKYIGETQKNIGSVFDRAARANGILFFDEADALFSRRTETSDAQDKYANAETAYLLQRIESHDGVCLLATNLLQNFDEAFRRRIGYMLHFPLPDEKLREEIWRGVFPAEAPVGELDCGLLARHLELSGASIRNCAVHGAYLAAMKGGAITMEYLLEGARNEYQKQGKTLDLRIAHLLTV